jgi:hypothetical protein
MPITIRFFHGNELIIFPLFLMGKIRLGYVLFGISPRIWNGLRTYTEVPLYVFVPAVFGIQRIGEFAFAVLGNRGIVRSSKRENICNKALQTVDVAPHKEIPFVFLIARMWVESKLIAKAIHGTLSFSFQRSKSRFSAYSLAKMACALAI